MPFRNQCSTWRSSLCSRKLKHFLHDAKTLLRQTEEASRSLNDSWQSKPEELAGVYSLFGFLTPWITQLEEWKFRLDNS